MTNEELLILKALHKLHLEEELNGLAFQAIAINATPDSETGKEFEKMANTAFNRAQIFYKIGLNSLWQNRRQYLGQEASKARKAEN